LSNFFSSLTLGGLIKPATPLLGHTIFSGLVFLPLPQDFFSLIPSLSSLRFAQFGSLRLRSFSRSFTTFFPFCGDPGLDFLPPFPYFVHGFSFSTALSFAALFGFPFVPPHAFGKLSFSVFWRAFMIHSSPVPLFLPPRCFFFFFEPTLSREPRSRSTPVLLRPFYPTFGFSLLFSCFVPHDLAPPQRAFDGTS